MSSISLQKLALQEVELNVNELNDYISRSGMKVKDEKVFTPTELASIADKINTIQSWIRAIKEAQDGR